MVLLIVALKIYTYIVVFPSVSARFELDEEIGSYNTFRNITTKAPGIPKLVHRVSHSIL